MHDVGACERLMRSDSLELKEVETDFSAGEDRRYDLQNATLLDRLRPFSTPLLCVGIFVLGVLIGFVVAKRHSSTDADLENQSRGLSLFYGSCRSL